MTTDRRYLSLGLALLLGAFVWCAHAASADYEAEVPVASRDAAAEASGLREALRIVLVRLTGDAQPEKAHGTAGLLDSAKKYVARYQFKEAGEPGQGSALWAAFDRTMLDGALRAAGVRLWTGERPNVLIWLATENGGVRTLVGDDGSNDYLPALRTRARDRGIPLLIPLLDLEDESQVGAQAVFDRANETILSGSQRYGTDTILAGALSVPQPGQWQVQWQLFLKGQADGWATQGSDLKTVLQQGLDGAVDRIVASRPSKKPATVNASTVLTVEGIASYQQYLQVLQYLRSLDRVKSVTVAGMDPAATVFTLSIATEAATLEQTIAQGGLLTPVSAGRFRLAQ
jgi:hypothetical protein